MSYFAKNLPRETHCFFGAEGGVSEGIYQSLNFNFKSDDLPQNLQRNMEIAASYFGLNAGHLHIIEQGVSNKVEYVKFPSVMKVVADGAVTDCPQVVLCIRTADCAPVLLADYEHGVIGAAHAGWRGALKGVIENCVELMIERGAVRDKIAAAVGPCIGQNSYETDQNFYQEFVNKDPDWAKFFKPGKDEHHWFDLEGFCVSRLQKCGIKNLTVSGIDTYPPEEGFFSFRRYTHNGLIPGSKCFPTELSAIVL